MDMRAYAALLGLWICDATPVESASPPPFPDLGQDFDHSHDLALAPLVARLGSHVPAGPVLDALTTFPGEHAVRRELADGRVVTAWLGDDSMIGAEAGGPWPSRGQYHPATMQWRDHSTPTGIGWLRVVTSVPIDATADVLRLDVLPREESDITVVISGSGEGIFIDADGELATEDIDANGLTKVRLTDVTRLTIELRD
jgi:hypothetical protein